MPSVLDQPWPSADSTSGEGRKTVPLFFRYFNGHCAVTTPTSSPDLAKDFPAFPPVRRRSRDSAISAGALLPSGFEQPPTQHLARAPLFFHFFNGTTPTSWGDLAKDFPLFPLVRYPPRGNSAISATPLPPPAHAALARSRRTYAVLPIA